MQGQSGGDVVTDHVDGRTVNEFVETGVGAVHLALWSLCSIKQRLFSMYIVFILRVSRHSKTLTFIRRIVQGLDFLQGKRHKVGDFIPSRSMCFQIGNQLRPCAGCKCNQVGMGHA